MAAAKKIKGVPNKTLEQTLWDAADKMRGNLEAGEYKHVVLGLVFLKYVSDAFEERRTFLEQATAAKYTNRSLTTAEIIAEIVELAKHMRAAHARAEQLGLSESEVAFYDAVVQNDSAVMQMGDETLKKIASELVKAVRESATIDWNLKDSVRAAMRAKIKRLLTKYDYPPDKEERAIDLVIQQAELLAAEAA